MFRGRLRPRVGATPPATATPIHLHTDMATPHIEEATQQDTTIEVDIVASGSLTVTHAPGVRSVGSSVSVDSKSNGGRFMCHADSKKRRFQSSNHRRAQRRPAESSDASDEDDDEEDDDDDDDAAAGGVLTRSKRRKSSHRPTVAGARRSEAAQQTDHDHEHEHDEEEADEEMEIDVDPSSSPLVTPLTGLSSPRSVSLMCEESIDELASPAALITSSLPKSALKRTTSTARSSGGSRRQRATRVHRNEAPSDDEFPSSTPRLVEESHSNLASEELPLSQTSQHHTATHICSAECEHTTAHTVRHARSSSRSHHLHHPSPAPSEAVASIASAAPHQHARTPQDIVSEIEHDADDEAAHACTPASLSLSLPHSLSPRTRRLRGYAARVGDSDDDDNLSFARAEAAAAAYADADADLLDSTPNIKLLNEPYEWDSDPNETPGGGGSSSEPDEASPTQPSSIEKEDEEDEEEEEEEEDEEYVEDEDDDESWCEEQSAGSADGVDVDVDVDADGDADADAAADADRDVDVDVDAGVAVAVDVDGCMDVSDSVVDVASEAASSKISCSTRSRSMMAPSIDLEAIPEPTHADSKHRPHTSSKSSKSSKSSGQSTRSTRSNHDRVGDSLDSGVSVAAPRPRGFGFGARVGRPTHKDGDTASHTGSILPPPAPHKRPNRLPIVSPFPKTSLPVLMSHSPMHEPIPYTTYDSHTQHTIGAVSQLPAPAVQRCPSTTAVVSTPCDPYSILDPELPLSQLFSLARTIPYHFSTVHSASKGWSFSHWSRQAAIENRHRRQVEVARTKQLEQAQVEKIVREHIQRDRDYFQHTDEDTHEQVQHVEPSSPSHLTPLSIALMPDQVEKTLSDLMSESAPALHIDPRVVAAASAAGTPLLGLARSPTLLSRDWSASVPAGLAHLQSVYAHQVAQHGSQPLAMMDLTTPGALEMRATKYQRAISQDVRPAKMALIKRTSTMRKMMEAAAPAATPRNRLASMPKHIFERIGGFFDLASLVAARGVCRSLRSLIHVSPRLWSDRPICLSSMTQLTGRIRIGGLLRVDADGCLLQTQATTSTHNFYTESEDWFNPNMIATHEATTQTTQVEQTKNGVGNSQLALFTQSHTGINKDSLPFLYHLRLEEDILLCPSSLPLLHSYGSTLHTLEIVNNLSLVNDILIGVMLTGLTRAPLPSVITLAGESAESETEPHQVTLPPLWVEPFGPNVAPALPSLTALTLYNCINFDLDFGLSFLPYYGHQLRSLVLSKCRGVGGGYLSGLSESELPSVPNYLGSLVHLQKLDLSGCREMTPNHVRMLRPLTQLTALDLSFCTQVDDQCLIDLIRSNTSLTVNLQRLYLQGCIGVSDHALAYALPHLTGLTVLDLSQISPISNRGVTYLIRCTKLARLSLRFQVHLTDSLASSIVRMESLNYIDINFCDRITIHGKIAMKNRKIGMPLHFLTV